MKKKGWQNRKKLLSILCFALVALALIGCPDTPPGEGTPTPLTGTVSITGAAQAGQSLNANTESLLGSGTISYQWMRGDYVNGEFFEITGATELSYTPGVNDVDKFLKVQVTRSGNTGFIQSEARGRVLPESAPTPTVTAVTVSPSSPAVAMGGTQLFTAVVSGTNSPPQSVSWTVEGAGAGTSITAAGGNLTVAVNESAATLTVKATSTFDNDISGTATVTVTMPDLHGTVIITGVAQVVKMDLTANTENLSGSGDLSYQWKRSDTAVSTETEDIEGATSIIYTPTEDDVGKFLRVAVSRAGSLGTVTSLAVGPVLAEAAPTPVVTGVTVSPKTPTVAIGGTQQFTALVTGDNDPSQTVSWSITENSSQETTISSDGLLTVALLETSQTIIVTATSTQNITVSDTASVTIPVPTVTSVNITPSSITLIKGGVHQFFAIVAGTNNPSQTVTWNVEGGIAGTSISSSGLLTVAANETAETLEVIATSALDTNVSGTAEVIVENPPEPVVTIVNVSPQNPIVGKGNTQQFSASVIGLNNPSSAVLWSVTGASDDTQIDESGLLSVAEDESASAITVTATSVEDDSKSGSTTVHLLDASLLPVVQSVAISPQEADVTIGSPFTFIASITGLNNPPQTVIWTVEGGITGTTITNGHLNIAADETAHTLTIKAASALDSSKTDTVTVNVERSILTGSILITGSPRVGSTLGVNLSNIWGIGTISYQWYRADTPITGATLSTYTPVAADEDHALHVSITRTGNTGTITSAKTALVQAAPEDTGIVNGTITVNNGINNVVVALDKSGVVSLPAEGNLTVAVEGSYQAFRWYIDGIELADEKGRSLTVNGADYGSGTYRILVIAYRNNVPYSQELRFSVN